MFTVTTKLSHSRGRQKRTACSLILQLLLFIPPGAGAGENPVKNAAGDIGYMATSPLRMDGPAALTTLGVLGAGGLFYYYNDSIRHSAQKLRSSTLDGYSGVTEKFGNGVYDLALLGALGGAGHFLKDEKLQTTVKLSLESFLAANAFGMATKFVVGSARPYTGLGDGNFKPFSFKSAQNSFPSGHTTTAFSIASVFSAQYDSFWVSFLSYGLASAVAMQRVYADKHWASDVFFGAALGTVTGRTVVKLARGRQSKALTIYPYFPPTRTVGVGLGAKLVF